MTAAANPPSTILVVEDDPGLVAMLTDRLGAEGYCIWAASSAAEAEGMIEEAHPDLIILDLVLPDANGLLLCANLRAKTEAPIIICSATKQMDDRILGFKLGADDFVAKPFSVEELQARIEAVLRRVAPHPTRQSDPRDLLQIGDLVIDRGRCRVTLGGEVIHLTPTEYRLLCALASRPDEVLSRKELAEQVWDYYDADVGRSLDVHMRRVRAKLNAGVAASPRLVTVRGFGYQLVLQASTAVSR